MEIKESVIKEKTRQYLKGCGYKVTEEPNVSEEVRLDLYAFKYIPSGKTKTKPDIIWIECKGDVGFSDVLEGLVRTAFANYINGGQGMLSLPRKQYLMMKKHRDFLKCEGKIEVICVDSKIESFRI